MRDIQHSNTHHIIQEINQFHFQANPEPPDPGYIERMKRRRDDRIAALKAQGKKIILVHSESFEPCGRYVCEGDDGFNGYDPSIGSITLEQEV